MTKEKVYHFQNMFAIWGLYILSFPFHPHINEKGDFSKKMISSWYDQLGKKLQMFTPGCNFDLSTLLFFWLKYIFFSGPIISEINALMHDIFQN